MDETSPRFDLPLLAAGQAQKEVLHNEALAALDLLVHSVAETIGDDAPPASPVEGQCWIVGTAPTGEWAGHAGALAGWTAAGWRFMAPVEGMAVWVRASGLLARRGTGDWAVGVLAGSALQIGGEQVVGARAAAIADPSGGATVDTQARAAIAALLAALRTHGLIAG